MNSPKPGTKPAGHPPPSCETINLVEPAEARGRNGWFTPTEVAVQRSESDGSIRLSVRSSRPYSDMPPIYMSLCRENAEALQRALARQIGALHAAEVTS